jgi:hypothetical protein
MDYEQLGAFYLGKRYDTAAARPTDDLILYDSRDLTTHAVVLGMTGSGKTGLCLALLEEALIDGVPVIAIDPKGDIGNLMLTFPELRPADFRPWIDEGQAQREGTTPDALAEKTAAQWRAGLAQWDQNPERITRLRDSGDVAIYTPGSESGLPLAVLRSYAAPGAALADDADAWRDRIEAAVSGLLALAGITADPLRSREHVLLSQIIDRAWRDGRDADLTTLIQSIQKPGFERIGAFDLESFYPAKDRMELALSLNTLLASPSFAAWAAGEPLDIARLLHTPQGKPRISIISIAHLGEQERMFFVTLLLQEIVSWMRLQAGTSSLRAILYMDEVFGYLPPTANPPSKKPLLTLLKQARAFGLGCVLATQNPVDLDYKALSNAGTWFLGRLQTERDKARVIEGLEGASAAAGQSFDRAQMEATLAGLSNRVFVLNNVHEDHPVVFQTRWAMSYLRGPMTRSQIQTLMAARKSQAVPAQAAPRAASSVPAATPAPSTRPVVPPGLEEIYLADAGPLRPALLGSVKVHFVQAKAGIDDWNDLVVVAPLAPGSAGDFWESAQADEIELLNRATSRPPEDSSYEPFPRALNAKAIAKLAAGLESWVYRSHVLKLWQCSSLKLISKPSESEGEFRIRVMEASRSARDASVETLRSKYAPKITRLSERIRTAEQRVAREQTQAQQTQVQSAISIGATVLGALFGRKLVGAGNIGRATTAARGMSRTMQEQEDVARATESVETLQAQLAELNAECQAEIAALSAAATPSIEALELTPKKSDITVTRVALAWIEA